MKQRVTDLERAFREELGKVGSLADAEALHLKYLGKKGVIPALLEEMKGASRDERPELGRRINTFKQQAEIELAALHQTLHAHAIRCLIEEEREDVTLPGRRRFLGRRHPVSWVMDEMLDVLVGMGFSVQYGPEVESDYYNFEGLNFPQDHPARDMQDTFYLSPHMLLRTHTSGAQLRLMESHKPPLRFVVPGKVFRNEDVSARSHVFFHQIEGLVVDKGVSFVDLLSTLRIFWSKLFQRDMEIRFRPSFFPFVEPGVEVDLRCTSCEGAGCRLCKQSGWLEVAGAGMVHPEVLKNGGIDPEIYTGFAWGMGIDRMAMLRLGVSDIRHFFDNDMALLGQCPP
jgi:phenylalanyl-tRNA synthetase alpha chain